MAEMKNCPECDAELKHDANFCESCDYEFEDEMDSEQSPVNTGQQREVEKQMKSSQTNKCPNCKAELASNTSICEWCGFVINQEGDKSIESISADLEEIIKSMKGIEHPTILSSFQKNSKISMPIFTIAFFLLAYKVNGWFSILGILFLFNALVSIFKKRSNPLKLLKSLKIDFDEKVRNFQTLYGNNNKYKTQIQNYQNEWSEIENLASKGRRFELISYGVIISIFVIALLLPDPKSNTEKDQELVLSENNVMLTLDSLLNQGNLELANQQLSALNSQQNITEAKAKIQLKSLENALKKVDQFIESGEMEKAKNELLKLTWKKNSTVYDMEQIEEKYYLQFIRPKNALNEKLPEDQKITVESELDF